MSIEKVLYTAQATSTGGREGRSVSSDNVLDIQLSTPRELGGAGGPGTNPEQLFAAGYSACFLGALKFVAGQAKVALPADTTVTGKVGIGQIPTGFGIEAELTISAAGRAARAAGRAGAEGAHRVPVLQRHPRQHRRDADRGLMRRGQSPVALPAGSGTTDGNRPQKKWADAGRNRTSAHPTFVVPQGGMRLPASGRHYQVTSRW